MKRLFLAGGVALALVPLIAVPAVAADMTPYHTVSATHGFATISRTEGCQLTEVSVSSSVGMYAGQPGPVNNRGLTGVLITVTDTCATPESAPPAAGGGVVLFEAEGRSTTPLVADPWLAAASVSGVLTGTDNYGNPVTINLDTSWTGTGPLEHATTLSSGHVVDGNLAANDDDLRRAAVANVLVRVVGDETDLSVTGSDAEQANLAQTELTCVRVPRATEVYPCFGFPG